MFENQSPEAKHGAGGCGQLGEEGPARGTLVPRGRCFFRAGRRLPFPSLYMWETEVQKINSLAQGSYHNLEFGPGAVLSKAFELFPHHSPAPEAAITLGQPHGSCHTALSPASVFLELGTTLVEGVKKGSRGAGSKYKMTWVIGPEAKEVILRQVTQLPILYVRQTAELGFLCPKWTERPAPSRWSVVILWAKWTYTSMLGTPTSAALLPWWQLVMLHRLPHTAPMGTSILITVVL